MCTFNGAAWVRQQLQSFLAQLRLPDELVICDDHSTDQTPEILADFARNAPFSVRIIQNSDRLGIARNFSQAIELCSGDFIALSDQDDLWKPRKLQVLEQELLRRDQIGLVFSDANLVDETLRPLNVRLWDTLYFDPLQRRRLLEGRGVEMFTRTNVVTGATLMFRAWYKPLLLPISPHWVHDGWIALLISAVASCGIVDEPLIDYRQHPRQQIGARRTSFLDQARVGLQMDTAYFQLESQRWTDALSRLQAHHHNHRIEKVLQTVELKARFCRDRYEMRLDPSSRWGRIGEHWQRGLYHAMAWGWKSLLQDVVIQP